jgi:ubiquinone/menaquinone biosynthesis C-methylase UbiE
MPAPYDSQAVAYDRRWARYTERSLGLLRPLLPDHPGRVLDVGCGTGALHRLLRPTSYVGVDLSVEMLRVAAGHARELVQASADALPLANRSFDLVVSASSMHDWPDPAQALIEIRRVLAPGGRLLLADWCADYLSIRLMRSWLRVTGRPVSQVLTTATLGGLLEGAGFSVRRLHRRRISPVWGLMVAEAIPDES